MEDFPLIFGATTAFLHVLAGPDHLAAVTPLVFDENKKGWQVGFSWGIGHLLGMLSLGLLFLFFKPYVLVEKISENSEFLVGFVLIFVGVWSLIHYFRKNKNKHAHTHGSNTHKASFIIGILHGFAGLSHFILLLPVLGLESNTASALYIGGFTIGTVVAMTFYTYIIDRLSYYAQKTDNTFWTSGLRLVGGVFAIVVGVFWISQGY